MGCCELLRGVTAFFCDGFGGDEDGAWIGTLAIAPPELAPACTGAADLVGGATGFGKLTPLPEDCWMFSFIGISVAGYWVLLKEVLSRSIVTRKWKAYVIACQNGNEQGSSYKGPHAA